jgi:hypothetical protein
VASKAFGVKVVARGRSLGECCTPRMLSASLWRATNGNSVYFRCHVRLDLYVFPYSISFRVRGILTVLTTNRPVKQGLDHFFTQVLM